METDFYPIVHSDEGKKIIEALDNLTPWDRLELISAYVGDKFSKEEYYSAFIEGTSYENDPIKNIIDNERDGEILDAIDNVDSQVIPDWVVEHGKTARVVRMEEFYVLAAALSRLPNKKLIDTLNRLSEYCKDVIRITAEPLKKGGE